MFLVDTEKAVRLQAKATVSSVYYYLFSYNLTRKSILAFNQKGVTHGDDARLFLQFGGSGVLEDPKDINMMKIFTGMLANYAKTGYVKIVDYDSQENMRK